MNRKHIKYLIRALYKPNAKDMKDLLEFVEEVNKRLYYFSLSVELYPMELMAFGQMTKLLADDIKICLENGGKLPYKVRFKLLQLEPEQQLLKNKFDKVEKKVKDIEENFAPDFPVPMDIAIAAEEEIYIRIAPVIYPQMKSILVKLAEIFAPESSGPGLVTVLNVVKDHSAIAYDPSFFASQNFYRQTIAFLI